MSFEAMTVDDSNLIEQTIYKRLNLKPGDKVFLQEEEDGSLRIIKDKREEIEAIFAKIHQEIKDQGGFESLGIYSDEDVAALIREQRNAKNIDL